MPNLCTSCGIDMGDMNPRQLCRKTYCENEGMDFRVKPIVESKKEKRELESDVVKLQSPTYCGRATSCGSADFKA